MQVMNFRLDYLSCVLSIASTTMIGRRMWQGWIISVINSIVVCIIALKTSQTGFIPANLFCIVMYAFTISKWRSDSRETSPDDAHVKLTPANARPVLVINNRARVPAVDHGESLRYSH